MWLLWTLLVEILYQSGQSLVLVQDAVMMSVPSNFPRDVPLYRVIAVDDATGFIADEATFSIIRTAIFPSGDDDDKMSYFKINRRTGNVYLTSDLSVDFKEYEGYTFALELLGTSQSNPVPQNLTLVITVTNGTKESSCVLSELLCFLSSETMYVVPESIRLGTEIGTMMPTTYQNVCPHIRRNYTIPPESSIAVHGPSGRLTIIENVDYEVVKRVDLTVTCQLTNTLDSKETDIFDAKLTLLVQDVNDNAPYLQSSTQSNIEMDASLIHPRRNLPIHFTVLDKDSFGVNNITVSLIDPLNLFVVEEPIAFHNVNKTDLLFHTVVLPNAKKPFCFPRSKYTFSVVFEDHGLITQENNKVVYTVTIYNQTGNSSLAEKVASDLQFVTSVSRLAALHAWVARPVEVGKHEKFSFKLRPNSRRKIFSVTSETGIIYVKNDNLLRNTSSNSLHLTLMWKVSNSTKGNCTIIVNIINSNSSVQDCGKSTDAFISSCAENADESSCAKSCGSGASNGVCKWRSHPAKHDPTPEYATCSPNFHTCPDRKCDELEFMDKLICPQDCADKVIGQGFLGHSDKGIRLSAAPCTCNEGNVCTCTDQSSNRTKLEARNRVIEKDPLQPQNVKSRFVTGSSSHNGKDQYFSGGSHNTVCGTICMSVTGLIVTSGAVLLVLVIIFHHVKKSHAVNHKYVGNKVPLTAVGSDYVDDRIFTGTESQTEQFVDKNSLDPKWEFPREHLIFEGTLGEGEFGKVVKAQAWEICGHSGYLTVAVKMLKENGTSSEEQDLISEFNLLKEVSHPNIIQLLGACTSKGDPLYVIVGFAEHGSLRNYLCNERKTQETLCRSVLNPSYFSTDDSNWAKMNRCGMRRELLSFAWQIGKGMAYLSDMKLVHRDLAARNILLAHDKIIKISDFGLSRDVYEGDTYLKTTKGRVPVKWMALESLEDHIYTIKSDVWSFGIVLWEIITLGTNPYPGIMAETLFRHLKEGYRMPQPKYCPDEVYNIMLTCWRVVPQERPSFKELVHKLDQLLQETVDYLPLDADEISSENNFSQQETEGSIPASFEKSVAGASPKNRDKTSSMSGSACKINIPKPSFSFTKNSESSYENSRLLPTSPEDSSAYDGSA